MTGKEAAIDERRLHELLSGETFVRRVILCDGIDSTNDELRRLAARGAPAGTVLIAEQQTSGRGRLGRHWYSPRSTGLYLSVLLDPVGALTRFSIAAAVAACLSCHRHGAWETGIKWPNDLLWQGRKLGGILAESRGPAPVELILGLGLNVLTPAADFPHGLSSSATSLRSATGGTVVERESLAAVFLCELARLVRRLECDDWETVCSSFERLAPAVRGQRVRVSGESRRADYEGTTEGLEPDGGLRIRRDDGRIEIARMAESIFAI